MKLFNTSDIQTVTKYQSVFDFRLPSVIIIFSDRCKTKTFRIKYESGNKLALSTLYDLLLL